MKSLFDNILTFPLIYIRYYDLATIKSTRHSDVKLDWWSVVTSGLDFQLAPSATSPFAAFASPLTFCLFGAWSPRS